MEMIKNSTFVELSDNEMMNVDGGSLTIAIAGCLIAIGSAAFAGGIAVGLNRKNRNSK